MPKASRPPDLAILYEHPTWFDPLFSMLDHYRIAWTPIRLSDRGFDPPDSDVPAPVILNRVAVSSFLREGEQALSRAQGLLAYWEAKGARVLNGARSFAVDCSKARQLSVIAELGLDAPATRIVHRREDLLAAAETLSWPLLVKANVGGSGAGIARYQSREALRAAIADGSLPSSIDNVLLVQDDVPPRGGTILRSSRTNPFKRDDGPDVIRATLEAIAYQSRDLVECMEADAGLRPSALLEVVRRG